jgi:hypothetical protein
VVLLLFILKHSIFGALFAKCNSGRPATGRHHYFYQLELEVDVDYVSKKRNNERKAGLRLAFALVSTRKEWPKGPKHKIKPPDIRFGFCCYSLLGDNYRFCFGERYHHPPFFFGVS